MALADIGLDVFPRIDRSRLRRSSERGRRDFRRRFRGFRLLRGEGRRRFGYLDGLSFVHLGRHGNTIVSRKRVKAERIAQIGSCQRRQAFVLGKVDAKIFRWKQFVERSFDLNNQIMCGFAVGHIFQIGMQFFVCLL